MRNLPTKKATVLQITKSSLTATAITAFFLFSLTSVAQIMPQEEPLSDSEKQEIKLKGKKERPEWLEKIHYGGNIGAGFFGAFFLDFAPMVGYEITQAGTIAGLGATFVYQGQFQGGNNQFAVGPRLFVRQPIWRSFFAHAEYELVNADERAFYPSPFIPPNDPNFEPQRKWGGSPLIGLGMYQGRNREQGGSFISVMYNLGYPNQGYINPQGIGGNNSPLVLRLGFFI
jgi:hypothetical protein